MESTQSELEQMRKDIAYIRKNMISRDALLTKSEMMQLREASREYASGKTTSLSEYKRKHV